MANEYAINKNCICIVKGGTPEPLCNFTAQIAQERIADNGVDSTRAFVIKGKLNDGTALPTVSVGSKDFCSMNWVMEKWGARARINAGRNQKDLLREAIQRLSPSIQITTTYTNTGWIKIGNQFIYLHAGGGIGANGTFGTVSTDTHPSLQRYDLPDPDPQKLMTSFQRWRRLLELGPNEVTLPLLSGLFRSVLGTTDVSLFQDGSTGVFKTELAALIVQHFGAGMNRTALPESWSSTANALENTAFHCKDSLLVIDDFKPTGSQSQINEYHEKADRVFRGQGNNSGRSRLNPDGSWQQSKRPRGMILSTGEDVPRVESVQARLVLIGMRRGDIDVDVLTQCQRDAREGEYAQVMASYIQWLAGNYEEISGSLRSEVEAIRSTLKLPSGAHPRASTNAAELLVGMKWFVRFLEDKNLLSSREAAQLNRSAEKAITTVVQRQAVESETSSDADQWIRLLRQVISLGKGKIVLGFKAQTSEGIPVVGWQEGDSVYVDFDVADQLIREQANRRGTPFNLTPETTRKRLKDGGFLRSADEGRTTVRRTINGHRREVLHFRGGILPETVPNAPIVPQKGLPSPPESILDECLEQEPYEEGII